jgi:hypothetical protein
MLWSTIKLNKKRSIDTIRWPTSHEQVFIKQRNFQKWLYPFSVYFTVSYISVTFTFEWFVIGPKIIYPISTVVTSSVKKHTTEVNNIIYYFVQY